MTADPLLEDEARKPIWLITLADVMLLLVGFFVFLQANQTLDGQQIAKGFREGFGVVTDPPMPVAANRIAGFAAGSAALPPSAAALAWAREALADPRTQLRVVGGTDGSGADVDPVTGSPAILAADRARAAAAALAAVVPPGRLAIETRPGAGRAVQLDLAFTGDAR